MMKMQGKSGRCMSAVIVSAVLTVLCGGLLSLPAAAQEKRPAANPEQEIAKKGKTPPYPRKNISPHYEVDAAWPQKPKDFEWAAMPGVAVDAQDQVWVFTRSVPPIQV
ncbi:MAG: hypothetical protein ACKPJD_15480, partial [Planctomycetaceae bacterium]